MDGEPHRHRFTLTSNVEGCHWWKTTAHCDCGAVLRQYNERDPARDAHVWEMLDPACDRCCELAAGARAVHRQHVEIAS